MSDEDLFIATHSTEYSYNNYVKMIEKGHKGSWLIRYNINKHQIEQITIPLIGNSLPEMDLDPDRGKLIATGFSGSFLCWDTYHKKITFAGYPPNGWIWWRRASLLDGNTGKFWSTDDSNEEHNFISFDPELNMFERYDLSVPPSPFTGMNERLRSYTKSRAMDGAYYCISRTNGVMFRFKPEIPSVETVGVNWDKGRYTSTMAMDHTGRYIYFMPGGLKGQNADEYGPIVQYDVETGTKKVLAWLVDYYYEKYGYWIGGTYGMEISNDGSFLVIVMNGAFWFRDAQGKYPYGNPSLFVVHIPEEERPLD